MQPSMDSRGHVCFHVAFNVGAEGGAECAAKLCAINRNNEPALRRTRREIYMANTQYNLSSRQNRQRDKVVARFYHLGKELWHH